MCEWGRYELEQLLETVGVTVVEVPGLRDSVCYVEDQRVGLIRKNLPTPLRAAALEWLFQEACVPASASGSATS